MSTDPQAQELTITAEVIWRYAELSGDYNPVHVDPDFAARTDFGKPIAHGPIALSAVLPSVLGQLGTRAWGTGLRVSAKYVAPAKVNDRVTGRVENADEGTFTVDNVDGRTLVVAQISHRG